MAIMSYILDLEILYASILGRIIGADHPPPPFRKLYPGLRRGWAWVRLDFREFPSRVFCVTEWWKDPVGGGVGDSEEAFPAFANKGDPLAA